MIYFTLHSHFFEQYTPPLNWQKVWIKSPYYSLISENLVPLYQWENIIYWGVAEEIQLNPTIQDATNSHWIFVSCSKKDLKKFWETYFASQESSVSSKDFSLADLVQKPQQSLTSEDLSEEEIPEGLILTSSKKQSTNNINKNSPIEDSLKKILNNTTATSTLTSSLITSPTKLKNNIKDSQSSNSSTPESNFFGAYLGYVYLTLTPDHQLSLADSSEKYEHIKLNTSQPSPFRIVLRTKKEYHGATLPNNHLQILFEKGLKQPIPPFLTILPHIENNELIGMYLAWAHENIQDLKHLNQIKSFFDLNKSKFTSLKLSA